MAHTQNSLASALRASQAILLEDAMEVRMRMLKADKKAWKMLNRELGIKLCPPPITLLRHCGASQAIQLEDAMKVRMRMLKADKRA